MAANFGTGVVKLLADEFYLARLWICANCPSLDPEKLRCKERTCGCRLKTKARWR